jgi:1,2-phenylacetyl-CoA epoxidase catalytic subunit
MKLKQLFFVGLSAFVVASAAGCHLFSKKSKEPKENPDIASGVEADFRQRWVDRRVAELTATGVEASTARKQAETEFREHYVYLKDGKK